MSERGYSRFFRTILLFLIPTTFCLLYSERAISAEQVDQSNLQPWDGGWTHLNPAADGQANMWQTFTPEYSNITAVEIDILTINPGRGDDTLTAEIAKDGEILVSVEVPSPVREPGAHVRLDPGHVVGPELAWDRCKHHANQQDQNGDNDSLRRFHSTVSSCEQRKERGWGGTVVANAVDGRGGSIDYSVCQRPWRVGRRGERSEVSWRS